MSHSCRTPAVAVNAFDVAWGYSYYTYAFPPFGALLHVFIRQVEQDKTDMVLVAAMWTTLAHIAGSN